MRYRITHATHYRYSEPVPVSHNQVHLQMREEKRQKVAQFGLVIHPEPDHRGHRLDAFGNWVEFFSIHRAHRRLSITASGQVEVLASTEPASGPKWEVVAQQLRTDRRPELLDAYQFAFDSPSIRGLKELEAYARTSFRSNRPIVEATHDLMHRIHTEFTFDPTSTTVHTPLEEVLQKRRGVCQDFAHLQIGCMRSLGLAARYVSGYLRTIPPPGQERLVGADASHAWLSVYCGEQGWVSFDPTNDTIPSEDHITVGWGRDYSDICPIQGTFVGGGSQTMQVSVDVAPLETTSASVDVPS